MRGRCFADNGGLDLHAAVFRRLALASPPNVETMRAAHHAVRIAQFGLAAYDLAVVNPVTNHWQRVGYMWFASAALVWAIANTVYVYLVIDGARSFRIESATFILVAVLLPRMLLRRSDSAIAPALTRRDALVIVTIVVILWVSTLTPFATFPFISDDYVFLASYRQFADILKHWQFFRPLFALTFVVLTRLGNGSTVAFHCAAMVCHATSAICVYVLARRLFTSVDAATFCFAIILLNPLQLEAVLWVSGLQELLWTMFVLIALVVYTGCAVLTPWRLIVTLALVSCALLSKETAVSSVLLIPAADWTLFKMKRGRLLPVGYVAFAVTMVMYLYARARFAAVEPGFFVLPGRYFVQKFVSTPYRFFVQPWNLMAAAIPLVAICAETVLALIILFSGVLRGGNPTLLAGPGIILISTLPVYAYFYVAPDLRATRYLYFPATGWAILVAHLLTTIFARRVSRFVALASLVALLYASIQMNIEPWRTAGEIVREIQEQVMDGRVPGATAMTWRQKYGNGLELKGDTPAVYEGVYLFLNGYPELVKMVANGEFPADRPR